MKTLPDLVLILESDSHHAAERLVSENFDLLITDMRMPGLDGMDLLRLARQHDPSLPVLMITGFPAVETAVESMKLGAADYIVKPFLSDDLRATVHRLLEERRLRDEHRLLQRQVERPYAADELIGQSPPMQAVFETIRRIAETDTDVLIVGETGTGKELVARSIHTLSARSQGPFVPVNCGAVPEELLESEFFGHERGAFTGAHTRSLGLFEFANGGTFFLDEVDDLSLRLQVKLLRVLQDRKVRRLGGKEEIDVNVRVLAATLRDLSQAIQAGTFRSELYYRINVARIDLPPLRERTEDIPLLMEYFVTRYAREMEKGVVRVDPEVIEVLSHYPWPGNVRELQNVIKRALTITSRSRLTLDDLPPDIVVRAGDRASQEESGFFASRTQRISTFEREYLTSLLQRCRGDMTAAAREAQLPRGTLYRLLKKYGLRPGQFRS